MPVLSAVIVFSLAAGIGVNTVVFAWVQARLWKPLPGVESSGAFHLVEARNDSGMYPGSSWREYLDLRDRLTSFHDLIAFRMAPMYVGNPGEIDRVFGMFVSDNYFQALGLRPVAGRFPESTEPGHFDPVAVISYGLWQTRFGGKPEAIGQILRVSGRELTVIGVTPREFQGTTLGLNFDVWLPAPLITLLNPATRELDSRTIRGYSLTGRLSAGATRASAQAELDAAMAHLAEAYPDSNRSIRAEVLTFGESPRGPQRMLTNALLILQATMLLMLLAVCGNIANLVLARASARQREIGVRLALGAGPWRISTLVLSETLVLSVIGAALGALIAVWSTDALLVLPLSGLPIRFQTSVDAAGLAFAMLLGVICAVLVGAAPAWQLARADPSTAFRSGTRGGRSRLRNTLMGVQAGLALAVLLVAGLFVKGFWETRSIDPGFRREGVLLATYDLAGRGVDDATARLFAARLLDRLGALPAVESAAISTSVPLDIHGLPSRVFVVDGRTRDDGEYDQALANTVTAGYFRTMEIPLHSGKDFAELRDPSTPMQVIVNDEFVRRYLARMEPLGRRVEVRGRTFMIAGIVRNSLSNAFGEPPTPVIYSSFRDSPARLGEIHLRTRPGAEARLGADVRRVIREIDPDVPVFNVRTLSDHVETNLVFRRIPARMFAVLGPLLLVLASIGIYAVVSYTASLQSTEIAVRLALGATRMRVIGQFVGTSLTVIVAGAAVGWLVAFVVALDIVPNRTIDVAIFAGVPLLLLAIATLACWLPARQASRINPIEILKSV
jgi:predicted permease